MSTYAMRVRLVGEPEDKGRFKSLSSESEISALDYFTISAENVVNEDERRVGNFSVDIFVQSEKTRLVASFLIIKDHRGCITHRPKCRCSTCALALGQAAIAC